MGKDIEALKKQSKLFKEISDLLNEAVEISEKVDKGEIEMSDEELTERLEEIMGRYVVKIMKIKET